MKSKSNSWTPERAKQWRREYQRQRRQDPSFRARENARCLKSMQKLRGWKRYERWACFPFGYEVPVGYSGHDLFVHFQTFLHEISGQPTIPAYYWKPHYRFDPRCQEAPELWRKLLTEINEKIPGVDHLQHIRERANRLIREEQASYHTGHRIT